MTATLLPAAHQRLSYMSPRRSTEARGHFCLEIAWRLEKKGGTEKAQSHYSWHPLLSLKRRENAEEVSARPSQNCQLSSAHRSRELSTQGCRFVRPQSWEGKVCLKGRGKRWRGAGGAAGKEQFPDKRLP